MYNMDLGTENTGIYLSHQMVDILSLINCDNMDEVLDFIQNTPNIKDLPVEEISQIQDFDLDTAKKIVFEKYQQSYTNFMVMEYLRKSKDPKYRFHTKLKSLKLSLSDEQNLFEFYQEQGEQACYGKLQTIVGPTKTRNIQQIVLEDYENIKSATYEQMVAFNEQIKNNISQAKKNNGDYTLVISSAKFFTTMFAEENDLGYTYDPHYVERGFALTKKLDSNTRFHCLLDCNTAKSLFEEKHYTKKDKERVLDILSYYTRESLQEIIRSNNGTNTINTVEIFNELVEYNKDDKTKPYEEVWQKYFDISIDDIIERCIVPNQELIRQLKSTGVDFMYNETLLQESEERRKKVEEVYERIQSKAPDLIDTFGDQMHFTSSDLTPEKIEQLKAEALFLQKMQQKKKSTGETLKIESTEFDFGIGKETSKKVVIALEDNILNNQDVITKKQVMISKVKEIFKDVSFSRTCCWTTLDNIDCRLVRESKKDNQRVYQLFSGQYQEISNMQKPIHIQQEELRKELEETIKDQATFHSALQQLQHPSEIDIERSNTSINNERRKKEKATPYAKHQEEKATFEQMKQTTKEHQQQKSKDNKVKVLSTNQSNNTHGIANYISLSILIVFGILLMIMFLIIK